MLILLLTPAFAGTVWFGAPVAVTPPSDIGTDVKTGDFNGDGLPDISIATSASTSWTSADRVFDLALSLSDGAGGFSAVAVPAGLLSGSTMVTDVADLDGDGLADLVAAHAGGFSVFFSDGATLATPVDYAVARVGAVELADIDGDGDIDLAALDNAGDLNVWANDGAGAFTLAQALPTDAAEVYDHEWDSLDIVDLDGDNALDVVVLVADASWTGAAPIVAYLGDGTGRFASAAWAASVSLPEVYDIAVGDIDGEGHLDVIYGTANYTSESIVWDGGFGAITSWPIATYAYNWMLTGDIDADGDTDVIGTVGFDIGVLLQDGGALVDQGAVYPMATTSSWSVAEDGIELVDMNGDGCADVVASVYGVGATIVPATGPACLGATPVAWSSGSTGDTGDTGDTGAVDTAADTGGTDTATDTGAPPPSASLCAVADPRSGSLALLALATLGLVRRRR